jgi:putative hemolysin
MDLLLFCFLLGCAAFFSGSETALFSLGKVTVNRLRQSESPAERRIAHLLDAPRDLLISVLFGNELANISLSIVTAWIVSRRFSGLSEAGQTLLTVCVVIPLLLLGGEVTPKTLAAKRAEGLARLVAVPLHAWRWLIRPVRWALTKLTDAAVRRFGGRPEGGRGLAEQEFRTLMEMGAEAGVVEKQEHVLIQNVLDFGDLAVRDVMTPHEHVFTLAEDTPMSQAVRAAAERKYSRIPIWRGDPRNVVGVVYAKDLLVQRWGSAPRRALRQLVRRPFFVLPKMRADTLLETFRHRRIHMAVVVDEFGRALGLVTMEDLLEELFGPITDAAAERKGEGA